MRPTPAGTDRRTVLALGAAAGVALLTGCSLNNPYSTASTPAAEAVRDLAPDTATAVSAVVLLRTQQKLLTRTSSRYPSLAARVSGLRALHQAHLQALVAAVPDRVDTSAAGGSVRVATSPAAALLEVMTTELALRDQLDDLALAARSGAFARLLGTMGAGTAQHLVALRTLAGSHGGPPITSPRLGAAPAGHSDVDALQDALAGEHAAVAVTAFLGAQTSQSRQPTLYADLQASYRTHRRRRDQLTVLVTDRGAQPVPAAAGYDLPAAVATTLELSDAALQVERRIVQTYGQLVENTTGAERRWALVALDNVAVVQLEFRGTPEMFPGSAS